MPGTIIDYGSCLYLTKELVRRLGEGLGGEGLGENREGVHFRDPNRVGLRIEQSKFEPRPGRCVVFLGPHFTQVYKWVLANLMLGGNPAME